MSSHFVQTLRRSARTLSKHLYQKVNESIKPSNAAWNASIALLGASAIGIGSAATAAAPDPASSPQPPAPAPQETPQSNDGTAQWRVFTDIARDLVREKRYDEAERYLLRALDAAKRGFGIDDPHVASACQNLAELYRLQQKYDLAAPLYDQALGILAEAYGPKDIRVAFALHNVAGFHYAQRSLDKAAQCYEQALQVKLTSVGPGHMETSNTLYHLGEVRWAQGRKEEGIRLARQSLGTPLLPHAHFHFLHSVAILSTCLMK